MTDQFRKTRSRGLKLAALTSLVSKGGNIVLQMIAIPMALIVLEKEAYGVYATIAPIIAFVLLSELGIGPGLTNILATNIASGNKDASARAFSTGFYLTAFLSALGGLIIALVVMWVPVEQLFGAEYVAYANDIQQGVQLGVAIVFVKMVTGLCERARAAYQETFVNNLYGALGNLVAGGALILGIHAVPEIWFLILTVNGALALASLGNFIHLLIQHPHLTPRPTRFCWSTARFLFNDGLAFCATMSLAPLLKDLGLRLLLGRLAGPVAVTAFDILERLMVFVYGFVVMFTFPLWPALNDALARGDHDWIRVARKRLYLAAAAYGVCFTLGLTVLGPWAIDLWLKGQVTMDRLVLFAFSLYVTVSLWHHVHHIFLAGLDAIRLVSVVVLTELPFFMLAAYGGYQWQGLPGLFFAIAAVGLIAAFVFPVLARRRMAHLELNHPQGTAEPQPTLAASA